MILELWWGDKKLWITFSLSHSINDQKQQIFLKLWRWWKIKAQELTFWMKMWRIQLIDHAIKSTFCFWIAIEIRIWTTSFVILHMFAHSESKMISSLKESNQYLLDQTFKAFSYSTFKVRKCSYTMRILMKVGSVLMDLNFYLEISTKEMYQL